MSKSKWHKLEFVVPKEKWGNMVMFPLVRDSWQLGFPEDQILVTISGEVDPGMLAAVASTIQIWCEEDED